MTKPQQHISWSSAIGFLGIASWLIGSWIQISGKTNLIFPYWQWWVHGIFLELVAVTLKLSELHRKKKI